MGQAFEAIVGSAHVAPLEGQDVDGVRLESVVRPGSPEQAAACLAVAREGHPLLLCGGRTKLHLGNPAQSDALTLLSSERLGESQAFEISADEGVATLGAGVSLGRVAEATRALGKRTLLPAAPAQATVGGSIAADPIGARHDLDRRLRGDVLGLEVALGNGEVTRSGGRVVKNVTGFDLVRLYCGSLGTLGMITQATLRLRALPEERRLVASRHRDVASALAAAVEIRDTRVELEGLAVLAEPDGVALLALLEGGRSAVDAAAARLGGESTDVARWDAFERSLAQDAPADSAPVRLRLGARPSDTPALCAALEAAAGRAALRCALPASGLAFADVEPRALDALWERARRERWSLFLERAPADVKSRFDVFGPSIEPVVLMHAIKARFDPGGVLAPGRFAGRI